MMRSFFISAVFVFVSMFSASSQISPNEDFNTTVSVTYKVKTIKKINTEDAEFAPIILGTDFIFVSDRELDLVRAGESNWKKNKRLNIYKASFKSPKDDSVSFSKTLVYDNNTPDYFHSGPICFHPSGNYAIITRVISETKTNKPHLFLIKKEKNKWSKPEVLAFCKNDNARFSYGHACFSDDGTKLYFSSDQSGSLGAKDIFVSNFNNGNFSTPVNLGEKINSASDEMYPFFKDGKLYFSSDKSGGSGKLDIYKSKYERNEFAQAENLGNTINSSDDDFSFYLTATGRNGFFASNRKGEGGDDIFFFVVDEQATVVSKNITGKFTFAKLDGQIPAGLELQLLDEAGNVVQTTKTDENGNFKFSNLSADQNFTIKVIEINPDLVLHIFNKDGNEYAVLMSDTKGSFVYKKLDVNDIGTLALMELYDLGMDGKKSGTISGQFMHERLLNETVEGLNVLLIDDEGNVFMKTTTDKNGNFTLTRIPYDQNLYLTTDSKYDDLKILLFNHNDEVVAELKRKGQSPFVFRRLDGKLDNALTLLENEDLSLFPVNYTNLSGKFKMTKLDGEPKELEFVVIDEAGNVLGKGTTDKRGNFIITGLPPKDNYIFKIEGSDASLKPSDYQLQMLSRYNQELALLNADEAGLYKFNRKPKEVITTSPETVMVYFEKNMYDLTSNFMPNLKPLLDKLKADPKLKLQIDGHADASSTDEYNRTLSMRRMLSTKNYFIRNGIASNRITGAYHGEQKLVNKCADATKCTEEENRLNRRCEVKTVK